MNITDYVEPVAEGLQEPGVRIDEVDYQEIELERTNNPDQDYPADRIGWDEKHGWFWESGFETTTDYGEFGGPITPPIEEIVPQIATFLARV